MAFASSQAREPQRCWDRQHGARTGSLLCCFSLCFSLRIVWLTSAGLATTNQIFLDRYAKLLSAEHVQVHTRTHQAALLAQDRAQHRSLWATQQARQPVPLCMYAGSFARRREPREARGHAPTPPSGQIKMEARGTQHWHTQLLSSHRPQRTARQRPQRWR